MEENVPVGSICSFCNTSDVDEALYGKLYKYKDLITHYFCLLLASKVLQRGSDEEGILGFLPSDIIKEVQRGKNLTCIFCRKRGATIACYSAKCKVHFHLPCGRKKDTFHQFFGEFKSYCPKHRLKQKINPKVLKAMSGKKSVNCVICLEPVSATPAPNTLWAPCCSKEAWFHRLCLQRLALSAGYFFKCPLCNNTKQFVEAMRTYGIWIPEQDASWEAEPERYSSLLERHNSCDAKSCRCRRGRTFHMDNTKWEIKLCVDCGSQGMHVQCGNLRISDDWACPICSSVTVHKENLSRANKRTGVTQSVQSISRRATRRVPHIIRRVTTRQSQPSQEAEAEEDNENEDVNVEDNVGEDQPPKDKDSEEPQQSSQVNNTNNSQSHSPAPNISFSRKKVLEPHSRPRDKKRRLRSGPKESSDEIEVTSDAPTTQEKSNDLEIIDVEDNSDDEVQILFTPNIKFIKTNEGVSLPVVKVPASSAPSGDGVVASGEPCQPSFNTVQTVDLEDGVCDVVMDECQPSTSHKYDLVNKSLSSVTENLVSGEPFPSDDDELQILEVASSKNHQSSMKENSVEAWVQPHALSTEICDEAVDISILKTSGDSKSLLTANTFKSCNAKTDSDAVVCLPLPTPNVADGLVANLCKSPPVLEGPMDSLSSSNSNYEKLKVGQTIIHSLPPLIDRIQAHNIEVSTSSSSSSNVPSYRNANGLTTNAWIGGREHCVSLSGPGPCPVMIGTFPESQSSALVSNSNVTMVHSTFSLPPSMLPPGTRAVLSSSIPIINNSQVLMPDARNHFIAPSLPSLNPRFVSQSTPKQVTASSDVMSFSTNVEHDSGSLASVAPQVLNSMSSSSVLLDTPLTEGQAYCELPSQVGQDDWSFSVQVVSTNGTRGPESLQMPSCPEDHPEVIVERNPGPVPLVPSLWAETKCESGSAFQEGALNGNSSTNCNPMQQTAGARERKQKLIERPDFNQCFSASNPRSMINHGEEIRYVAGNENLLHAPVKGTIPLNVISQTPTRGPSANNMLVMTSPIPQVVKLTSLQNSFLN